MKTIFTILLVSCSLLVQAKNNSSFVRFHPVIGAGYVRTYKDVSFSKYQGAAVNVGTLVTFNKIKPLSILADVSYTNITRPKVYITEKSKANIQLLGISIKPAATLYRKGKFNAYIAAGVIGYYYHSNKSHKLDALGNQIGNNTNDTKVNPCAEIGIGYSKVFLKFNTTFSGLPYGDGDIYNIGINVIL